MKKLALLLTVAMMVAATSVVTFAADGDQQTEAGVIIIDGGSEFVDPDPDPTDPSGPTDPDDPDREKTWSEINTKMLHFGTRIDPMHNITYYSYKDGDTTADGKLNTAKGEQLHTNPETHYTGLIVDNSKKSAQWTAYVSISGFTAAGNPTMEGFELELQPKLKADSSVEGALSHSDNSPNTANAIIPAGDKKLTAGGSSVKVLEAQANNDGQYSFGRFGVNYGGKLNVVGGSVDGSTQPSATMTWSFSAGNPGGTTP